jgi:hypothetical protein
MKVLPNFVKKALSLLLILGVPFLAGAQTSKKQDKQAKIKALIESQRYVFSAQTALPMSGRLRQLTTDYSLKVGKDTVVSDLPYFGQAYTAPMDPSQSPLEFTSTSFEYTVTAGKKGGWNVQIKPKNTGVQQMNLSISENGYASLQVNSVNRQAISFNGVIVARKK